MAEKPNPERPRRRRRVRKSGTRADVKRLVWEALTDADRLLRETPDEATRLRCVSAISTAAGVYGNLLDAEVRDDERSRHLVPRPEAEAALRAVLDFAAEILGDDKAKHRRLVGGVRARVQQAVDETQATNRR